MIPISKPFITKKGLKYVTDAVTSGWVSSLGPYISAFEERFAEFCGVKYALSVSNGTVGLHLALKSLGIGDGDEVVIPDLTFVATANAVVTAQATPVMVDVKRDTYCIDPDAILKAITSKTKAILPVHLYGHPAEMAKIKMIAQTHGLFTIEDAAEAHGAATGGQKVGALGDCAVFSFYGNKIITTGEGGMITTSNVELFERMRSLRDHAMSKEIRYWHEEVGYNYRLTNMQAALGLSQLEEIDNFLDQRAEQLYWYRKYLEHEDIEFNPCVDAIPVNWLTCAVVKGIGRNRRNSLMGHLRERGIDSRPFFYPVSSLPMYKKRRNRVSERLSEDGLNLPTYIGLGKKDIKMICENFIRVLEVI